MPIAAAPSLGLALLVAYSVTVHFAGEAIARAWPAAGWLLAVPPVAVNLALCWLFGRTLVRGRTPLIARFALMEQGNLAPDLACVHPQVDLDLDRAFRRCRRDRAGPRSVG